MVCIVVFYNGVWVRLIYHAGNNMYYPYLLIKLKMIGKGYDLKARYFAMKYDTPPKNSRNKIQKEKCHTYILFLKQPAYWTESASKEYN